MGIKSKLRKECLQLRNEMTRNDVFTKSQIIAKTLCESKLFEESTHILLYAPIKREVDTSSIADMAYKANKKVYYPCVEGDFLVFYEVSSPAQLRIGYHEILEPMKGLPPFVYDEDMKACCVVPGVAFDANRNRIGYGKGFYDRFLAKNSEITTVGLAFDLQMVENVPISTFDIPLQVVITEERRI